MNNSLNLKFISDLMICGCVGSCALEGMKVADKSNCFWRISYINPSLKIQYIVLINLSSS